MTDIKKKVVEPVDPWTTPRETWPYVTIPEDDPLGTEFPTITLNKITFHRGESYQVPPQVAAFVNERIKVYNRSCVRLLQPNVDRVALREVSVGTTAGLTPAGDRPGYVDASQIKTL